MKIQDDDLCTFCKIESETIEHLFHDCKFVKPIWKDIVTWLNERLDINLQVEKYEIILGKLYPDKIY